MYHIDSLLLLFVLLCFKLLGVLELPFLLFYFSFFSPHDYSSTTQKKHIAFK